MNWRKYKLLEKTWLKKILTFIFLVITFLDSDLKHGKQNITTQCVLSMIIFVGSQTPCVGCH